MKVVLAFLLNVAFNFAVGLLVAKFLGPEEYGRFALALATAVAPSRSQSRNTFMAPRSLSIVLRWTWLRRSRR